MEFSKDRTPDSRNHLDNHGFFGLRYIEIHNANTIQGIVQLGGSYSGKKSSNCIVLKTVTSVESDYR